jgi:hypothetical protein
MKKFVPIALMVLASAVCVTAQQDAQSSPSLGDVVRKQHAGTQANPSRKVWTNEDFSGDATTPAQPTENAPAAAEPSADNAGASAPANAPDATADKSKQDQDKAKSAAGEQEKLDASWKEKLDVQKARIADLKREYDLTERENKISMTTYYADAGNRLRDQKDFTDKEASYRDKMTTLQKQIADEQAKLSDMQDEAHKAGANKAYD